MKMKTDEYELLSNDTKQIGDAILYRIKALKDINPHVKKETIGGYVQSIFNLDAADGAWIYGEALVYDEAQVYGEARVCDRAWVCDKDKVNYSLFSVLLPYLYNVTITKDKVKIGCETFDLVNILTKTKILAKKHNISETHRKLYKSIIKLGIQYYKTMENK